MNSTNTFQSSSEAPPPSKDAPKKRSAFAVLMANQAKKQRLEKSRYRHSKDAFEELMQSAREPGAFDGFDDKYPNQNNDDLGEYHDDGYGNKNELPTSETDSYVIAQLGRVDAAYFRKKRSGPTLDCDCWSECESKGDGRDDESGDSDSDCSSCESEKPKSSKDEGVADGKAQSVSNRYISATQESIQSTSNASIADPRTQCTPGSKLRKVKIHHSDRFKEMIMGFTFVYSDGTQLSCGNLRGSYESEHVDLDDGDGIIKIISCYRPRPLQYMTGMKVYTKSGKTITMDPTMAHLSGEFVEDNELQINKGHILKSIKWDEKQLRITGLETVEMETHRSLGAVPSLTSLARKTIEDNLRGRSMEHEKVFKSKLKTYSNWAFYDVQNAFENAKKAVRRCSEADKVRKLRVKVQKMQAKLALAEHNLSRKVDSIVDRANTNVDDERETIDWLHGHYKDQLIKGRNSILSDMKKYRQTRENYQLGTCENIESGELTDFCTSPTCLKFFDWSMVPASKRCSFPGCVIKNPSCGCNVEPCSRCHTSLCERHAKQHKKTCKSERKKRCGYDETHDRVHPFTCGRIVEVCERVECYSCKKYCCLDCVDQCTGTNRFGRPCNKLWCKQCQQPFKTVYHTCCTNCSFHDRTIFDFPF